MTAVYAVIQRMQYISFRTEFWMHRMGRWHAWSFGLQLQHQKKSDTDRGSRSDRPRYLVTTLTRQLESA